MTQGVIQKMTGTQGARKVVSVYPFFTVETFIVNITWEILKELITN